MIPLRHLGVAMSALALAGCLAGNGANEGGGVTSAPTASPNAAAPAAGPTAASTPGPAELPRVWVDSSAPDTTGYQLVRVAAGADLQAALNAAVCGSVIELPAGATFTGNFSLPRKDCAGKWVVLRSDKSDRLPVPGTRIDPLRDGANLARIVSPNAGAALNTHPGASYYRITGIEFGYAPTGNDNWLYTLVAVYTESSNAADLAHHMVFDRVYIHGSPVQEVRRGMILNGSHLAVVDSYIGEIHQSGFDSQAVASWAGTGPLKITNNFLEAATENVFIGGTLLYPDMMMSDIEIRRNHIYKNPAWCERCPEFAGKTWFAKNLFEAKSGRRMLLEGNLMENTWPEGQVGFAFVLTPRADNGTKPVNEDFTIRNNIIRHVTGGVSILGYDSSAPPSPPVIQAQRITVENNLFEDVDGGKYDSAQYFAMLLHGPVSVTFNHNTVFNRGYGFLILGELSQSEKDQNLVFTNNIVDFAGYGLFGGSVGTSALEALAKDYVFTRNVIRSSAPPPAPFPPDNYFPASWDAVGFRDFAAGTPLGFALADASTYKAAGTDGKDIGANMAQLHEATRGAKTGIW